MNNLLDFNNLNKISLFRLVRYYAEKFPILTRYSPFRMACNLFRELIMQYDKES